jgi:hypothetical protein
VKPTGPQGNVMREILMMTMLMMASALPVIMMGWQTYTITESKHRPGKWSHLVQLVMHSVSGTTRIIGECDAHAINRRVSSNGHWSTAVLKRWLYLRSCTRVELQVPVFLIVLLRERNGNWHGLLRCCATYLE